MLSGILAPEHRGGKLEKGNKLGRLPPRSPSRGRVIVVAPTRAQQPLEFLDEQFVRRVIRERRGVAVFVPTRAEVEKLAVQLGEQWKRLTTAFDRGGEPIRVIRPFLESEAPRPWLLARTAAGQSALNVRGLDTAVSYDARYGNVVERGRNVLHRKDLGANEILKEKVLGEVLARTLRGASFREGRLLFGDENPRDVTPLAAGYTH